MQHDHNLKSWNLKRREKEDNNFFSEDGQEEGGGRIGNFEIGFVFKAQCVNFWIARAVMRCVSTRTPPQAFTRTCDDGISQDLVVYRRRRFVRCPPDRAFLIQILSHFRSYLETTRSKSDCHFSPRFRLEKRVAAYNFRMLGSDFLEIWRVC